MARQHSRSAEAEAYRHLYADTRWRGPHGVRKKALVRDGYQCQHCGCILITGDRHHPHAAVVHHKKAHKGDPVLFFDLNNTESVCKSDHDTLLQKQEVRGYVIGNDINGRPLANDHPWNRARF